MAQDPLPGQFGLSPSQVGAGDKALQSAGVSITGGSTVKTSGATLGGSVYLGPKATPKKQTNAPYAPGFTPKYQGPSANLSYTGKETTDLQTARLLPTTWSEKEKRDFISKGILYKIPGFNADMGMPEIMSKWDDLVNDSMTFSRSGTPWSPYDVMNSYANDNKGFGTVKSADGDWLLDAATGERIKYIGPRTKTTTEKRVDLSSAEDVRALTTQMLTELLGRAPTAKELSQYRSAITGLEKESPSIATTTQTLNEKGEVVGTSTQTSGGVSDAARQQIISEQAKQGPEYGKYQSATTYFNAMMQMLGG